MRRDFIRFIKQERGTTAIEYAIIASLVSTFIVAAVLLLGENVKALFDKVAAVFH